MFRIQPGSSCHVSSTAPYNRKSEISVPASPGQRYDQVEFSSHLDDTERRVKETVSHLSQEIRTRFTSQDLDHLRQQISSGQYRPNAREIAARMLLLREDC